MKNILFIFISAFLIQEAFSQSGDNDKYTTLQIAMLMGSRQVIDWTPNSFDTRFEMQVSPSVTITKGRVFNQHWAGGIGVGFEIFDYSLFPVFADIRYHLWDSDMSPFFALKFGYAFADFRKKHHDFLNLNFEPYFVYDAEQRNYGGFLLNPEMGVKVPLNENNSLLFTVAYRYQRTKSAISRTTTYDTKNYDKWKLKENLYRLSFGVALMFR
jgi:hypothetical protein